MKEVLMLIMVGLFIAAQINKQELTLKDLRVHNEKAIHYHVITLDAEYKLLEYGNRQSTSAAESRGAERILPEKRVSILKD